MNFRKMSSEIARIEGKKREVTIGNIREVLKITLHLLGKEIMKETDNGYDELYVSDTIKQIIKYGQKKLR